MSKIAFGDAGRAAALTRTMPRGISTSRRATTGASRRGRGNRPERKNPLTFDSYAEMRDLFRDLTYASDVRAIVMAGAGGNFSSGGDVFEIIEPLTKMKAPDLIAFTRMTGDVVRAMRKCPQPIIASVDEICAGAGAILAMASDLRLATPEAKTAFLFTRVGLAGAHGCVQILPRIIGQGRAAELLYSGRTMSAAEGVSWGFYNSLAREFRPLSARQMHSPVRSPTAPGSAWHDQDDDEPGMGNGA